MAQNSKGELNEFEQTSTHRTEAFHVGQNDNNLQVLSQKTRRRSELNRCPCYDHPLINQSIVAKLRKKLLYSLVRTKCVRSAKEKIDTRFSEVSEEILRDGTL